ncbi:MAG: protein phosphatase 2C domain-containing protein [Salaquimonas sp.]
MRFNIVDHIRNGSTTDNSKSNDDWIGFEDRVAIVADGATGLAENRLMSVCDSDAQWVAKLGVDRFLNARADDSVRDLVREINSQALALIGESHAVDDLPRYAWPTSGFIMARLQSGLIEISGLGDCSAIVEMTDGYIERFSALPFNKSTETRSAKNDRAKASGSGEAIRSPEVISSLRQKRNLSNTIDSGVWTLGLVPEASDHVLTAALPLSEIQAILLMSDGFSAACDSYELYDEAGLLGAAKEHGLAQVIAEIRRVERLIDPDAVKFPRYKQCDDSSAILLEIAN